MGGKEHYHGEVHEEPSQIATEYPPPFDPPLSQEMGMNVSNVNTLDIKPKFREIPVDCQCSYCHKYITTTTFFKTGTLTWIFCLVFIFLGCWLGCCLIPFACDSLKDVVHQCPNCHNKLYRYDRLKK
ncbi:hypothetical protein DICPUDRAFT_30205 [Dictyostelium purpureum]|uniref:LITAF domain-containing protein n=1 Tax=Dictyostelium purpureum TaxID=5786 RepID=F0ZEW2_DICPU|nr:uncharacterized protein DICPUDRAFT_30205 [Dictyostelium purpureum]EGC37497.1 hypothetical protein DICPUDRAFT_30205 [Dictyostelium purpureum]|eukprot:XP_003285971.1 hypothetical protein DICPUDRAFT_30205 [Dictyostelium purpureum]